MAQNYVNTILLGDEVNGLCFSVDGRKLIIACEEGRVKVYNMEDASSRSFSAGRSFADVNADMYYEITGDGYASAVTLGDNAIDDNVTVVATYRDLYGSRIGAYQKRPGPRQRDIPEHVRNWVSSDDVTRVNTLAGVSAAVYGIADGSRIIASCSEVNDIKIWNGKTGKELGGVNTGSWNRMAAISPNGRYIAAATWTGSVMIWSIGYSPENESVDLLPVKQLVYDQSPLTWLCFNEDSNQIITASQHGYVQIWNITDIYQDPKPLKQFHLPRMNNGEVHKNRLISLSPNRDTLAVTNDKDLHWISIATGQQVKEGVQNAHSDTITCIEWSPCAISLGRRGAAVVLATGSNDKSVKLWSL